MGSLLTLPDYVSKAFSERKCAIGKFWGQTHIYVPIGIAQKVGEQKIKELILETFGSERLQASGECTIFKSPKFYFLELPSVLTPGERSPDYNLPDTLVERIMHAAKE